MSGTMRSFRTLTTVHRENYFWQKTAITLTSWLEGIQLLIGKVKRQSML